MVIHYYFFFQINRYKLLSKYLTAFDLCVRQAAFDLTQSSVTWFDYKFNICRFQLTIQNQFPYARSNMVDSEQFRLNEKTYLNLKYPLISKLYINSPFRVSECRRR